MAGDGRHPFYCILAAALLVLLLSGVPAVATTDHYAIDQRYGTIGFSVSELGLFETSGTFHHFDGKIALDPQHPEATKIAVRIAVTSAAMASERARKMLLSAPYFDAPTYPWIRFRSTSVTAAGRHRYRILGSLEIRGVTRPEELDAALVTAKDDPKTGGHTAYFTVTGTLRRTAFGMTANENFVGEVVHLVIHIHLTMPTLPDGG